MQKNKLFALLLMLSMYLPFICGREHVVSVRSQDSFYKKVQENPFAIVLFYGEDKHDKGWYEQIKQVLRAFRMTSDSTYYRQARLRFVAVDVGRKGIDNLQEEYGIHEVPAFVLFKGGAPVRNKQKQIVVLGGFASQERIKSFINKYLRDALEEQLRLESERREEQRSYYGGSASFGFGYAYDPYYPYYYGNYGYPYGYYGNYYGPGVGFGVSFPI